jgi:hypothetical protein
MIRLLIASHLPLAAKKSNLRLAKEQHEAISDKEEAGDEAEINQSLA